MSEGSLPGVGNIDDGNSGSTKSRETISIDSQSFVNVGQLMESRGHSIFTGASSNLAGSCSIISCSDSDADGLRDFDQIVRSGSSTSAWSSHERCAGEEDIEEEEEEEEEDDNDSVLPALPRSPAPESPTGSDITGRMLCVPSSRHSFNDEHEPGWSHELGSRATALVEDDSDENVVAEPFLPGDQVRDSTLEYVVDGDHGGHPENELPATIPMVPSGTNDDRETSVGRGGARPADHESLLSTTTGTSTLIDAGNGMQTTVCTGGLAGTRPLNGLLRESWLHVPAQRAHVGTIQETPHVMTAPPESSALDEQKECGEVTEPQGTETCRSGERRGVLCLTCVVQKTIALARPSLEYLAQLVKVPVEAGAAMYVKLREVFMQGRSAIMKAIDDVPQAPVRMWVARVASSLVLGAILGGAMAYYAFPRVLTASTENNTSTVDARAHSSWSASPDQQNQPFQDSFGSPEEAGRNFGDRLNRALLAARAGEVAAQQGLLEEVRDILAATGKSGGISAEQILRQFNAKRFAEASRVWAAAEGFMSTDPLYFTPPSKMYNPGASSHSSQNGVPSSPTSFDSSSCDIDSSSSCKIDISGTAAEEIPGSSTRDFYARDSSGTGGGNLDGKTRPIRFRSCGGGGWVC